MVGKKYIYALLFSLGALCCAQIPDRSGMSIWPDEAEACSNPTPTPLPTQYPDQSNLIYRHDINDLTPVPTVGSVTYTRSGSLTYPTSATTVAEVAADAMPIGAMRWGGSETLKGAWLGGSIKNWLLRSEAFDNAAWTAVGTGATAAGSADSPLAGVDTLADTISGSDVGDGVEQDSGTNAGSVSWVFSVYLKTASTTATAKIVVKDAGTQAGFVECPLTTTWRRCQVPHVFNSGTGTVTAQILVGNTSNVRAWGAQLERFNFTNTVGSRDRRAVANAYVRTVAAVASSGNSTYEIPNSITSQIATKGTMAFWVMPEYEWFDLYGVSPSISQAFFSLNFDVFSLVASSISGLSLYINSSVVASTGGNGFNQTTTGIEHDRWQHITITWNTATDAYHIYLNGQDRTGNTTVSDAINVSTSVMNVGCNDPSNFSYICADSPMSEILIWKTELSQNEVADVYSVKSAAGIRSDPDTGLIFAVDLGTSMVPTTGDTEYYFNERGYGAWHYADSTTTLKPVTMTTSPLPAYPLNGANVGGMAFNSNNQNLILQSEAIATTWAAVGSPTITEAGGTFLGVLNYGTINGASGTGITQTVATPVLSTKWTASMYASVSAGTLAGRLTLEGSSGGTPETTNCDITITTTPKRFNCYASFTSSATGNIKLSYTNQASGTARVGGFMLETADTVPRGNYAKIGSPYQKTTTTAATSGHNMLIYRANDSFNVRKGTAIIWAFLEGNNTTEYITSNGPSLISAPGQYGGFYWHVLRNIYRHEWVGVGEAGRVDPFTDTPNQWTHWVLTWNYVDGVTNAEVNMYVDGVLVDNTLTANPAFLTQRKIMIGGDGFYGPMDYWAGAIKEISIYGSVKDATFVLNDFNSTKAAHGR